MKLHLIILFLLLPTTLALDCSILKYQDECNLLNASDEVKINLDYYDNTIPLHDYAKKLNDKIEYYSNYNDYQYIKKSFLSIINVENSIYYDNQLIGNKNVMINTLYDFDIEIPDNYYNDNKRDGRVCKIKYSLDNKDVDFDIYQNEVLIGNSKSQEVEINKKSFIESILKIDLTIKKKYYKWDKYCDKRDAEGRCIDYDYNCDYDRTLYKEESITLKDSITIYPFIKKEDKIKIREYKGNYKVNIIPQNNIKVLGFDLNPINYEFTLINQFVYVKATKRNVTLDIITSQRDCEIRTQDFFNTIIGDCNIKEEILDNIKTDKLVYKVGERINVSSTYPVTYANQTNNFTATRNQNIISNEYDNHYIAVIDPLIINTFLTLVFALFLIFKVFKIVGEKYGFM